jgi:hypothetical protein
MVELIGNVILDYSLLILRLPLLIYVLHPEPIKLIFVLAPPVCPLIFVMCLFLLYHWLLLIHLPDCPEVLLE